MCLSCLVSSRDKVSAEAAGPLPPGVLTYFLDGIVPLLRVSGYDNQNVEAAWYEANFQVCNLL